MTDCSALEFAVACATAWSATCCAFAAARFASSAVFFACTDLREEARFFGEQKAVCNDVHFYERCF